MPNRKKKHIVDGVKDIAVVGAETGVGMIPFIGAAITATTSVLSAVKNKSEHYQLLKEQEEILQKPSSVGEESKKQDQNFEDRVLTSLADYVGMSATTTNQDLHPVIIVVDDAQFAEHDTAVLSILKRLINKAWAEQWPILLVMTYWSDRWYNGVGQSYAFPNFVTSKAVAEENFRWTHIPVNPLKVLLPLASKALPQLPEVQHELLVAKADGNPRYLERLLQMLAQSPALFVDRSIDQPLTDEAISSIASEKFDIHEVTRRLFDSANESARQAAALASLLGNRFICELVEQLAAECSLVDIDVGLKYCERPLDVIGGVDSGMAEFVQGVFREVAQSLVSRVIGSRATINIVLDKIFGIANIV